MSNQKWALNGEQRQRVEAQYQQGLKDGNFHEMYQELADIMDTTGLPNGQKLADSSPQYENARRWLEVATCANGGFGPHSDFIRHYTDIQGQIRLGRSFTEAEMQTASNAVALNLYNDLHKSGWQFPTIDRIANLDAVAVGNTLYKNANVQECALSTNCAWTGAVAFSPLQSDQTHRLLATGNPKKADTLDDHLNIVYASYAYDESAKAVQGGLKALQTIGSLDEEGRLCGMDTQIKISKDSPDLFTGSFYADNVVKNSLAAPAFAQVYKLDADDALDMLRSAYGGKIIRDTNNNMAHDDFKENAHAFHRSLTLEQRNKTPVQMLQGTPEQWLQMAAQDNYTGKVYRNTLLTQSAYLVALPEAVLDQRPGVAHPARTAKEQNALVNGAIEVATELKLPLNQINPLLKYKAELDTPAQQQTATAPEIQLNHPKAIAMHAALEKTLTGQLDQYSPEQQKNIIAYATAQIVNATPMVGENPITLAKALDNGNLVMKSEFFIAHFKTETGAQTPAAESLTQTNQITQRQDIELANMMALSQQQLQSNAPTISRV